MSLPSINAQLTAHDLYPDRIRVTFRYQIARITTQQTFAQSLRHVGFSQLGRTGIYRRTFHVPEYSRSHVVIASRPQNAGPVFFTTTFNALSDLHRQRHDYGDEISRTQQDNWLHPDDVGRGPLVFENLYEQIAGLEMLLIDLAQQLASGSAEVQGHASLASIRVTELELCADIASRDPNMLMRCLAPRFKERFQRVAFIRYRPSARGYGELHADSNLIRGYLALGEQYKLYDKTNRRARLECEVTRTGLHRLRAPRSITSQEDLIELRDYVARRGVLAHMNALLGHVPAAIEDHGSILELFASVGTLFRRDSRAILENVLQIFAREGRLTSRTLGWPKLNQMREAGVLQNISRGVYGITPRFRLALAALRRADNSWQGE